MKKELIISNWNRKEHYHFFKDFEEPFYGITVNLDCTHAYHVSKTHRYSFFLYYLHKSLTAVNAIESFRYRIEGEKVFIYDTIHASITVSRPDNTLGFADIEYYPDYGQFEQNAKTVIETVKRERDLKPSRYGNAIIHFSTLPWLNFTSLTHARKYSRKDSCAKISFGKIVESNRQLTMPVSIYAHHALIDGFQVGEYMDLFQHLLNQ